MLITDAMVPFGTVASVINMVYVCIPHICALAVKQSWCDMLMLTMQASLVQGQVERCEDIVIYIRATAAATAATPTSIYELFNNILQVSRSPGVSRCRIRI